MAEIAIFGGSFNPPTMSHEAVVKACLETSPIEEVWLMPSSDRADKDFGTTDINRLVMVQAMRNEAFQFDNRVRVCTVELELPKPTQTWRTVEVLRSLYPNDQFHFVFGADSYTDMPNWQQGKRLQTELGMLIMQRDSCGIELRENVQVLPALLEAQNISSTGVREAIGQGLDVGNLVCKSVANYIQSRKLYPLDQRGLQRV